MQLKITTEVKRSIIVVELETINFCKHENDLLDQFGEPEFIFEKTYIPGNYVVSIHKKIRSNFKIRVKFDGSKDDQAMIDATTAVNQFIEEVQEAIDVFYDTWISAKEDIMLDLKTGQTVSNIVGQNHVCPQKQPYDYPPYPYTYKK